MSNCDVIKTTSQDPFASLSEVINFTGNNELFIKHKMTSQIALETRFKSLLGTRLCIVCIEMTNLEKGGFAYPPQEFLMQLIGASSEESVRQVTRLAEKLGWLRSEPVYENGKCKGVRYFMAWGRWNERIMARHANDNTPQPEMGTPPARDGDTPSQRWGNNTYRKYLEDKRLDSSASATESKRESLARSKMKEPTANAVVTGLSMDEMTDQFLEHYPLDQYIQSQQSRSDENPEPDLARIRGATKRQLKKYLSADMRFTTLLAGVERYSMYLDNSPEEREWVQSPQSWLSRGSITDLNGYEEIDSSIIEQEGEEGMEELVMLAKERQKDRYPSRPERPEYIDPIYL